MTGHGTRDTEYGAALLISAVLACFVLTAAGCQEPKAQAEPDLPTLRELEPSVSGSAEGNDSPPSPPNHVSASPLRSIASMPQRIMVRKLVFQRDDSRVDLLLQSLDDANVPGGVQSRWQANGLRLGSLGNDRLPLFTANLPRPIGIDSTTIVPNPHYMPITLIGQMDGAHRVTAIEPDGHVNTLRFIGGSYQMLVKLYRQSLDGSAVSMDLLPHHYGPEHTLVPRRPEEKMLDGHPFDALRVDDAAPIGRTWIVWAPTEKAAEGQAPHLGRAMLTGRRGNTPVRIVLLISVVE